jgi:hypothetical protein
MLQQTSIEGLLMARARISLGGYRDPLRRPRWIVWTIVAVVVIVAVMIPVLGITSTRWFCSEGCHKVQDDTITAYEHSPHSEISCMACHMPVNANPVVFLLHKAEALGELAQTVTNNYQLPLNAESEVALTMKSTQCTQCHNEELRKITPSPGLKIDHRVHAANEVQCTICHNRTAHVENFELTLKDPKTGTNEKHENFMKMTACFRCHTQDPKSEAPPGQCFLCHTNDFDLLPESHKETGFFPQGHGELASEEESRAPWMNAETATETVAAKTEPKVDEKERYAGENLPTVKEINLCSTCHAKSFCTDCHGVPMPHPSDFVKKHGPLGIAAPQVCAKCHGFNVDFCNNCHHGTHLNYAILPNQTWKRQHPLAVNEVGAAGCIQPAGCHSPTYCAVCHANGGTMPKDGPKL